MSTIYVKPTRGLQVRDPKTGAPIPEVGADVPRSVYWLRRLRDGDVIESKAAKPGKEK